MLVCYLAVSQNGLLANLFRLITIAYFFATKMGTIHVKVKGETGKKGNFER